MGKEIFFKINTRVLNLEMILVSDNRELLFFICKDDTEEYYIALCKGPENEAYIVVKTTIQRIVDLLTQKLTMRDIIIISDKYWHITTGDTYESDVYTENEMNTICLEYLPYENSYFKTVTKEHKEFLIKLENEIKTKC